VTEEEALLADELYGAIMENSRYSVRSKQTSEFKMGVSDLGFCSERMRRMIDKQVPEDTDLLAAFIGTWLGEGMETAVAAKFGDDAIIQAEVTLALEGDYGSYRLSGHPDLIIPNEGLLIDFKTDYGLATISRQGPSRQQQYQRHGYAQAAHDGGLFGDLPLDQVRVANAWLDRAAIDKGLHVQMESFNPDQVREAAEWLDDVIYAYTQGEEARKEPPREMCAVTCGFFATCRAFDTDAQGLITDPAILDHIEAYTEAQQEESAARRRKDQAKRHLEGIKGSTGQYTVRWIHINESVTGPSVRRAHEKLEIRKIR
jgi:hypothetical protein